ncbi:MAG: hypothetical protein WA817_09875 [Candidatus Acidiferrum sp.]
MSPSDLPWWGWILCAAGAALAAKLVFGYARNSLFVYRDEKASGRAYVVGWVVSVVAGILGLVGLVRLIKWIWES